MTDETPIEPIETTIESTEPTQEQNQEQNQEPTPKRARRSKVVECGCAKRRAWMVKQGKALAARVGLLEEAVSGLISQQQADEQEVNPIQTTLGSSTYHQPKRFIRKK